MAILKRAQIPSPVRLKAGRGRPRRAPGLAAMLDVAAAVHALRQDAMPIKSAIGAVAKRRGLGWATVARIYYRARPHLPAVVGYPERVSAGNRLLIALIDEVPELMQCGDISAEWALRWARQLDRARLSERKRIVQNIRAFLIKNRRETCSQQGASIPK